VAATQRIAGVDRHDCHMVMLRVALAKRLDGRRDVSALRLRQSGGNQADHLGRIFLRNRMQCFDHVVIRAENRHNLLHRRRLQRNRFAEMAHEEELVERSAATRAMLQRQAAG